MGDTLDSMRISEIVIENYRIFKGKHTLPVNKNLVFFVGENNTGKSTVFEAIDFLKRHPIEDEINGGLDPELMSRLALSYRSSY